MKTGTRWSADSYSRRLEFYTNYILIIARVGGHFRTGFSVFDMLRTNIRLHVGMSLSTKVHNAKPAKPIGATEWGQKFLGGIVISRIYPRLQDRL